jgi:hypothetical protein
MRAVDLLAGRSVVRDVGQDSAVTFAGEVRQPVERAFHVRLAEAGALEIPRERLALGDLRSLIQHVAVEHIYEDVQNGAIHQCQFTFRRREWSGRNDRRAAFPLGLRAPEA